jgi:hypothetical protein
MIGHNPAFPNTLLNNDLVCEIGEFLGESKLHHTSQQFRDVPRLGAHLIIYIYAYNIDKIIGVLESATNTLDHASFEIKIFDAFVQSRLAQLCSHTRKLKINFRTSLDVHTVHVNYVRQLQSHHDYINGPRLDREADQALTTTVCKTIEILKQSAKKLASLSLDFATADNVPGAYRPKIGADGLLKLLELKDFENLSRLYIDLSNNYSPVSSDPWPNHFFDFMSRIDQLYGSATIHTLSLVLFGNLRLTEHCYPVGNLMNSTLKSLHVDYDRLDCPYYPGIAGFFGDISRSNHLKELYLNLRGCIPDAEMTDAISLLDGLNLDVFHTHMNSLIPVGRLLVIREDPLDPGFMEGFTPWHAGPFASDLWV